MKRSSSKGPVCEADPETGMMDSGDMGHRRGREPLTGTKDTQCGHWKQQGDVSLMVADLVREMEIAITVLDRYRKQCAVFRVEPDLRYVRMHDRLMFALRAYREDPDQDTEASDHRT